MGPQSGESGTAECMTRLMGATGAVGPSELRALRMRLLLLRAGAATPAVVAVRSGDGVADRLELLRFAAAARSALARPRCLHAPLPLRRPLGTC